MVDILRARARTRAPDWVSQAVLLVDILSGFKGGIAVRVVLTVRFRNCSLWLGWGISVVVNLVGLVILQCDIHATIVAVYFRNFGRTLVDWAQLSV